MRDRIIDATQDELAIPQMHDPEGAGADRRAGEREAQPVDEPPRRHP